MLEECIRCAEHSFLRNEFALCEGDDSERCAALRVHACSCLFVLVHAHACAAITRTENRGKDGKICICVRSAMHVRFRVPQCGNRKMPEAAHRRPPSICSFGPMGCIGPRASQRITSSTYFFLPAFLAVFFAAFLATFFAAFFAAFFFAAIVGSLALVTLLVSE